MNFQDKTIKCYDCGNSFVFSVGEQEIFSSKGHMHMPKRCPSCRQSRKARQSTSSGNNYGNTNSSYSYKPVRQTFSAVCAECGKETKVPFEPRAGRPVYCGDCYNKVRVSR